MKKNIVIIIISILILTCIIIYGKCCNNFVNKNIDKTFEPTEVPLMTNQPTAQSTEIVTEAPTPENTATPEAEETAAPTEEITPKLTAVPTQQPTATAQTTNAPTAKPTAVPTVAPTNAPVATVKPTAMPMPTATPKPTAMPTPKPTATATAQPTAMPTIQPTMTLIPTITPSPTIAPTVIPTVAPTLQPKEKTILSIGKTDAFAVESVPSRNIFDGTVSKYVYKVTLKEIEGNDYSKFYEAFVDPCYDGPYMRAWYASEYDIWTKDGNSIKVYGVNQLYSDKLGYIWYNHTDELYVVFKKPVDNLKNEKISLGSQKVNVSVVANFDVNLELVYEWHPTIGKDTIEFDISESMNYLCTKSMTPIYKPCEVYFTDGTSITLKKGVMYFN